VPRFQQLYCLRLGERDRVIAFGMANPALEQFESHLRLSKGCIDGTPLGYPGTSAQRRIYVPNGLDYNQWISVVIDEACARVDRAVVIRSIVHCRCTAVLR
jgi:hypothetical protein